MAKKTQADGSDTNTKDGVTARLDDELVVRMNELAVLMAEVTGMTITKSNIMQSCVKKHLPVLEKEWDDRAKEKARG